MVTPKHPKENELTWQTNERPRIGVPLPERKRHKKNKKERPLRTPRKPIPRLPQKRR